MDHANPLAFLRGIARRRANRERCELCSADLADDHEHLMEPAARRLLCSCTPCAILFSHRGGSKYRRVPRRVENMAHLRLTDMQWEAFGLPIALAFFLYSGPAGRMVAVYPSPAGATESALPLEAWEELVAENAELRNLEPDVEALLVNRVGAARNYFRVGIDQCYRLAGILRTHWRGFSGGTKVWQEIAQFFETLKGLSRPVEGAARA
jgi:hypothetical protein